MKIESIAMKKSVIIFIILASFISCLQNTKSKEKEYLNKAIKEASIGGNYQWMVILPGLGCHGCIQEAEFFMKEYITDNRILFVLTKVSSLKILQQKTEVRINEHSNILIDKNNLFVIPTNNRIYPCVAQLKNGIVIAHNFQSPRNSAFYQLEQQLK